MKNRIISVIAGITTGWVVVYLGEILLHTYFPTPENFDFKDKIMLKDYIFSMPVSALILILFVWALSAFFGGLVSGKLAKAKWQRASLTTGIILLVGNIANFIMIPHPVWVMIISVLMYLPLSFIGGMLINNRTENV